MLVTVIDPAIIIWTLLWRLSASHCTCMPATRPPLPDARRSGSQSPRYCSSPLPCSGSSRGAYNHLLKNILYFGGAPTALMHRLFPPPTYEMPNDAIFEVTGILQVLPAVVTAYFAYQLYGISTTGSRDAKRTVKSA